MILYIQFRQRKSYRFIMKIKKLKHRKPITFYDPKTASQQLVDEVFEMTKNNPTCPTGMGLKDTPVVAHEWIDNSTIKFTDEHCHAPMMDKTTTF